jgi:prepilin-type N-terminal cleavage/methylation domain-containing protein
LGLPLLFKRREGNPVNSSQSERKDSSHAVYRLQKGFSLIELLIVVAIILVIAAIALPNLLKSRMAAQEASAVNSIRTYTSANVTYAALCPGVGFPATLADLGPGGGACAGGANLVDPILGSAAPKKAGYSFTYTAISGDGSTNTNYVMNGNPVAVGVTGQRYFFCNETGVIRYNLAVIATVADPSL